MCGNKTVSTIGKILKISSALKSQSWVVVSFFMAFLFSGAFPVTNSMAGEVWVANMKGANVQVIDTASNKVVKTIATGAGAHNVTFSPDGKLAYIANLGTNSITIIDAASKKAVHTMATDKKAITAVFSPDGATLYVVNAGAGNISVVDVKTKKIISTRQGAKGAMAIKPTKNWGQFWLTAPADNKLLLLNSRTGALENSIDVPGEPHGLVHSPDGKTVFVGQRKLGQIAMIDTASLKITKTLALGKRPDMIAISSDGKTVYIAIRDENKLAVVSTADLSLITKIDTDGETHGVGYRD